MLSMMVRIRFSVSASRISVSTRSQMAAVSSMRVPVGARMCSLNSPVSTLGKKSCPSQGRRQRKPRSSKKQNTNNLRCAMQLSSNRVVAHRASVQILLRILFASARKDCATSPPLAPLLRSATPADTWPWWAPGFARAGRTPASRIPPLRPEARRDSGPRR